MDDLDRTIIARLTEDGRIPYSRIAQETGVVTTTIHQRVKRLTERGIIAGSRVLIDWKQAGVQVTAIVSVEAPDDRPLREIAEEMQSIPFIQNCYAVTGEFDLLLTVRAKSSDHLGELLEEIRMHAPGRSRTIVVLSTYFEARLPSV